MAGGVATSQQSWRLIGVEGHPLNSDGADYQQIEQTQYRVSAGFNGRFNGGLLDGIGWDTALTFMENKSDVTTNDLLVNRIQRAFNGLGGAGCNYNTGTPGVGACKYLNPFSNGIATSAINGNANPFYNAAVANDPAMKAWLYGTYTNVATNQILVFDAVINKETSIALGGGNIAWAAGAQYRYNRNLDDWSDLGDVQATPCVDSIDGQQGQCANPTGPFVFFGAQRDGDVDRRVGAVFAEVKLPVLENLEISGAVRHEDFGGNVGSTTNPRISGRWQATDWLAFRGSAGTTFRAPGANALTPGSSKGVRNIAGSYRAVVTENNPFLEPETATTGNLGAIVTAGGFTASVDTDEEELEDLFRNFGRKNPDRVLDGIEDEDVWVTTGDDSQAEELAPTSGKVFLRLERDGSHLLWGDFRPSEDLDNLVRSDRTLYGVEGTWVSPQTMPNGEAKLRFSAYAAQPDTLLQRDVFRGTGGSTYFLSRRDIEEDSETLIVETRDPVSGRLVSSQRLVQGRDYRIDHVQGVVILTAPLSPSGSGDGLVTDRPLGDYDVNLVAQYEYVPTTGDVGGISAGGRGEVWVSDTLRLGLSVAREGSGIADSTLAGADLLWQRSDETWLRLDVAESEGPGFGTTLSLNGGLEIDPASPSAGTIGNPALGYRLEGRVDLAEFGGTGFVSGYFEDHEAGFTSPDLDVTVAQTAWGLDGEVGVTDRLALTFGTDSFEDALDKTRTDGRIGAGRDHKRGGQRCDLQAKAGGEGQPRRGCSQVQSDHDQ
ncbi:MAG: hypothetical protein B7Y02_05500 [Rhodobacterales bacterium 17-64-5]|nr:MAG: hypothetical protein B7Y02_05500 [Rhodobacterales bacterium 17-64-5]